MDDGKSAYSPELTTESATYPEAKKRRFIRTLCRVPADVKPVGAEISLSCTITDISSAGCYMEMLAPLPVDSHVEITLLSPGTNLQCMGAVRHSLAGMGMGVKFDGLTPAQRRKLQEIVPEILNIPPTAAIHKPRAENMPEEAPRRNPQHVPHPANAGDLLEATVRVLLRKGFLTRAELLEELEKGKSAKP